MRGLGLLQAIELVRDRATPRALPAGDALRRRGGRQPACHDGVFVYPGGCDPARDVVCFGPPFAITPGEIDFVVGAVEKALGDVLARLS